MNCDGLEERAIPLIVLILGSYDDETKRVLLAVKEEIAKMSTYYSEYVLIPLLLEDIEIYRCEDNTLAIVERYGDKYTVMVMDARGELVEVNDLPVATLEEVEEYLRNDLGLASPCRLPILEKMHTLANSSFLIITIRHVELTRCGEYIELAYLLSRGLPPSKIVILVNKNIHVSTMLKELIRAFHAYWEEYSNLEDLLNIVRSIIHYRIDAWYGKLRQLC